MLLLSFLTVDCSCCSYLYLGSPIMWVTYLGSSMTTCLKELYIRFTARAFRKLVSVYVFSYFPFGFEGRIWDLIVSVPDHCLSFYFSKLLKFIFRKSHYITFLANSWKVPYQNIRLQFDHCWLSRVLDIQNLSFFHWFWMGKKCRFVILGVLFVLWFISETFLIKG